MPTENKPADPGFDLNTPDGGRGYLAHLFKTVLKRHDYRQYINERLAGDFACTLAQHFEDIKAREAALQLRLNAADQRIDELTPPVSSDPVTWGAPKTVRQLIQQLQTLDQDLRPLSMLRVPGNVFEDGKERTRAVHLSFSHERVDGQWLAPFKGDGEKVLAFWCRTEKDAALSFEFEHPSSKEKRTVTLTKRDVFDGMEDYFYDKLGEQICQCESVGETNVVDCNCDEYVHDFEIVHACLDATAALNATK